MNLQSLRALHEKATPLPWRWCTDRKDHHWYDEWAYSVHGPDDSELFSDGHYDYEGYSIVPSADDARLMVEMRNALPDLLARLERAEKALKDARDQFDCIMIRCDESDEDVRGIRAHAEFAARDVRAALAESDGV